MEQREILKKAAEIIRKASEQTEQEIKKLRGGK